jgi:hypothetical protein
MKYVGMNEVVFDPQNVAFHGLGNCHGIVYLNSNGLFAYHLPGVLQQNRVTAFAYFVTHHANGGGPGLGLYGYCPANRYTKGDKDHKAELQIFAMALNYAGRIRGHRWDMGNWATTFVDVYHNQGHIMNSIEKFEDIKENGNNPDPVNHQSVHIGQNAVAQPIPANWVAHVVVRTGQPKFFLAHDL